MCIRDRSEGVAVNDGTITTATMTVTLSAGVIGDLTLELSADGGGNDEGATNGVAHAFTNTGTELQWQLTAAGNVTITLVEITYS